MPAVFQLVHGGGLPEPAVPRRSTSASTIELLSVLVAGVLIVTYVAGLVFSLKTHRDLFNPEHDETTRRRAVGWSARRSVAMLAVAGVAVGVMSEILVGSISAASESLGLSEFFIGVIVVAIVGNAAEHWVAVLVAHEGQDGPVGQHRDRLERPGGACS